MSRRLLLCGCVAAALCGGDSSARAADYFVKPVVGPLGTVATVADVNAGGEILGTWRRPDGSAQAFVVREGRRVDLGELDGKSTFGIAISDSGLVLGAHSGGYFVHDDDGFRDLGSLAGLRAKDINDSGTIVGAMVSGTNARPARWIGGLDLLPLLGGRNSAAYAINNRGQVVGGGLWSTVFYPQSFAWRYEAGAVTGLSNLGGQFSVAYDVNAAGTAVGEARLTNGLSHAFRSAGPLAAVDLGTLPGELTSIGTGINAENDVVGRGSTGGWLHSEGVMTPLTTVAGNPPGWQLLDPVGIADDGLIAGNGRLDGESRAFVLTQSTRVPLIFVPGITGSVLERSGDELWPRAGSLYWKNDEWLRDLRLDETGRDEWPGVSSAHASDIVRSFDPYGPGTIGLGPQPIYAPTIGLLAEAGYVEGEDLLVFPFDWRRSATENGNRLIAFMKEHRRCETCRFDVLAHSQGGLVTMSALQKLAGTVLIRRVVTLGTPVLGSPKALGLVEFRTPCLIEPAGVCLLDPATSQEAVRNMPGVYELMPSRSFHTANGSPLRRTSGFQDYHDWTAIVKAHRNAQLMGEADTFHGDGSGSGLDDFSIPSGVGVEMLRVVGSGQQTYDYVDERRRTVRRCVRGREPACREETEIHYEVHTSAQAGDGTVLVNSADLRSCLGDTSPFDNRNGIPNRYFNREHLELAQTPEVIEYVAQFYETGEQPPLRDCGQQAERSTSSLSQSAAPSLPGMEEPIPADGVQLEIVGGAVGSVDALAGGSLGVVEGAFSDGSAGFVSSLDGGALWRFPADSPNGILETQIFTLNRPGTFVGDFTATDGRPLRLRVRRLDNGIIAATGTFDQLEVPVGGRMSLTFGSEPVLEEIRLAIDADGNGTVDRVVAPGSIAEGEHASDADAPVTEAAGWSEGGTATLSLEATDTGSGVGSIRYSVDDGPELVYEGAFTAPAAARIAYFAVDQAGNAESVHVAGAQELAPDGGPSRRFAARPILDGDHLQLSTGAPLGEDWFTFVADGSSTYRVQLLGDFRLELIDESGVVLTAEVNGVTREIRTRLEAGRYFVRVRSEGAVSEKRQYQLKLQTFG